VKSFIDLMAVRVNLDPSEFIFQKMQIVCGNSADDEIDEQRVDLIVQCMTNVKQAIEDAPRSFMSGLLDHIRAVFGITGVTYDDCRTRISEWFNKLDENQRDPGGSWHTAESRALIKNLGTIVDAESTMFSLVPKDLGLGAVADWNIDKTQDYVAKLREGIKHIEENAIKVESPVMSCVMPGQELKGHDGKWQVQYSGSSCVKIEVPKVGIAALLTDNGEDPSAHGAQVQTITDSYEYRVSGGNKTVCLVSRDADGNFGKVCSVEFVDQLEKYVVKQPDQPPLPGTDTLISIVLPTDPASLQTTIRTLVESSVGEKKIDRPQAVAVLREIADQLEA